MSHLTRTAFSPDDESDYENTNRNMRDLDPDYNCITNNNVLTTKYYLENDFNAIIKSNDDYVKGFSIMHLNVRSIPKNIDKLNSYLLSLDIQFSIIGLTETWLKEETLDLYELPEYKSIHLTRPSRKGGGVSLYIHNNYDYVEKPNMNIMTELIECLFVEVMSQTRKHKRKILVGIVYRPPNTSISAFTEQLTNIVRTLRIENKQCYIMGDFNINLLNYDHHMETHDYVDAMFSNCLIPQITKPTRITPTTATLIDNIYSNDILGEYNQLQGILYSDISDHLPIFILTTLNNDKQDCVTIETRKYTHHTIALFKSTIEATCWNDIYACKDPQISYTEFLKKISQVYNKSFPLNTKRVKKEKHKAWITKGLRNSIKTKHKLYKYFLNKPTAFNETNYKRYKNKLTQLIKIAECYHYQKEVDKHKSDLKKMWQMIHEKLLARRRHHSKTKNS